MGSSDVPPLLRGCGCCEGAPTPVGISELSYALAHAGGQCAMASLRCKLSLNLNKNQKKNRQEIL